MARSRRWTKSSGGHVIECVKTPTHMTYRRVCAFIALGGNYALPPNTHVQWKVRTDRSAQTGIQTDARTHAGSQHRDAPQIWHPLDPSSGHLKGLKTISPSLFFVLPLPSLPPSVLALASVQTTNHIDGFVFNSLNHLFLHHRITSSCSVGNIQESEGLTSPKRCFGRQPALGQAKLRPTSHWPLNQGRKTMSGWRCHWSYTFFSFRRF